MIKELQKGNKAQYHGYLLGIQEYEDYMKLKDLIPKCLETIRNIDR